MQYRRFGKMDWQVSALGFGAMRLPTTGEPYSANVDEAAVARMLHYAIEHGLNYIDSAYPYHEGESERVLGRVLKGGYRDQVRLATKLPCWLVKARADFDRFLNEQLERLQTGHIEFYLLHGLEKDTWAKMCELDILAQAEQAIADGRISYLGFSFHDEVEVLKEILDAYDGWSLCQVQYNYMDVENQAGTEGVKYAASKGVAVVVMEPLRGGQLVAQPGSIRELWSAARLQRTPAEWALDWLWSQPEVSVVLSGMTTMEQVQQNIASADRSGIGMLTDDDLALVARVRDAYRGLCQIPCTQCGYCMPCPNGVYIPRNFVIYNDGAMYGDAEGARGWYRNWLSEEQQATHCVQCRECEDKCPQKIPISEWMSIVHQVLAEGQPYDACPRP